MEICFIIASYLSLICLIMASYMRHGWIWGRILDTGLQVYLVDKYLFIAWYAWSYLFLDVCPSEVYVVLNVTTVMHECNCIYFKFFTSRKMGKTSLTFHFHTHLKFNAMEYNKLTDSGENAIASSPSIFVGPEVCPLGFCWDGTSPKFYQNTWKIQILLLHSSQFPFLP